MNPPGALSNRNNNLNTDQAPLRYLTTALVVFGMCFILDDAICRADPSDTGDEQGVQVLTRGPVHEAFAGIITSNPEPGVVVPKAPPETIEEVPPDEKPEGTNVTWIPGYWAWDDERNDFLWVSGNLARSATRPRMDGWLLGENHARLSVDFRVLG